MSEAPVPEDAVIRLPEILDVVAATALTAELLAMRGRPATLDGSAVQRIGGLCLQVLLAAREAWRSDACSFRIESSSERLVTCLGQMGAGDLLEETGQWA